MDHLRRIPPIIQTTETKVVSPGGSTTASGVISVPDEGSIAEGEVEKGWVEKVVIIRDDPDSLGEKSEGDGGEGGEKEKSESTGGINSEGGGEGKVIERDAGFFSPEEVDKELAEIARSRRGSMMSPAGMRAGDGEEGDDLR